MRKDAAMQVVAKRQLDSRWFRGFALAIELPTLNSEIEFSKCAAWRGTESDSWAGDSARARDAVNDSGNRVEEDADLLFNHHGQQLAANRVHVG